jgi:hypothetical protein
MKKHSNRTRILIGFLLFHSIVFFSGCGLRYVEDSEYLKNLNSPRLIDPDSSPFEITVSQKDPNVLSIQYDTEIILEKPFRIDYRRLDFVFARHVVIDGQLPNGKTYPICIDSGCAGAELLINPHIVRKNHLETLFSPPQGYSQEIPLSEGCEYGGLCYLPNLKIGMLKIQNPCGVFVPWRMEWHVLGIPIWKDKTILMGISLMSRFRYLHFDNVNKQLEFSCHHSFQPGDPNQWTAFPLNPGPGKRAMVDIPIEGITCKVEFDTGGRGIILMPRMWESIRTNLDISKPKKSKFLSHQYGYLPCNKTTAKELTLGNITIRNAQIIILPFDTPYLSQELPGSISIWEFKDTSVVLDFEHRLMWVKNQ